MANKMASLAKDTAIYGLSSIIGRFLNYMLVPLYTAKIKAETGGYGEVTEIYAWTALFLVLLTFGMETTLFRFANKERVDTEKAFSTSLISVGTVSAIFALLCWIFIKPISSGLGYQDHPEYIKMMSLVVAFDAFQAILFSYLRLKKKAIKFATLKLLFIVVNISLNLFVFLVVPKIYHLFPTLLGWFNSGELVRYIFTINLICTTLLTLGFIPELKGIESGVDPALLKRMLKYSWPLLLLGLTGILNQVADKICFKHLIPGPKGVYLLGVYGGAIKVAMIMTMLTQAFRYAYEPIVFSDKRESGGDKKMYADAMKYFVIFALLAFLTVVFYIDVLRFIIDKSYWDGLAVVPIVMIAEIFMGVYFNLSFWYKLSDETWWGAIISGIGCIVLFAVNILFVPKYGYMASAWGGFAGYGVCMILSYFIGQKKSPVDYPLGKIGKYILLAAALWGVSELLNPLNFWLKIVLRTLLLGINIIYIIKNDLSLKNIPYINRFVK
ncbi:MAG TPA: polysaccharide biosynthesis C-terminal domain-containing protein [Bacteroidaceae bacterium]|nr:polysaccharide biosynthesis C-terminal domain-containing protein [Bacteroidaceae bacterium]